MAPGAEDAEQVEPVLHRHGEVAHQNIGTEFLDSRQRAADVGDLQRLATGVADDALDPQTAVLVIVDDENAESPQVRVGA